MVSRLTLHQKLKALTTNVYFQPPSAHEMSYPCIRYVTQPKDTKYADNIKYINKKSYQLTIIDDDPDSELPDLLEAFPLCKMERFYTADDLNHWVFTLYF